MSHPIDDELVDAALGDATTTTSAHLAECESCAAAVAELRRTVALAHTPATDVRWQAPADSVWDRISADLDTVDPVRDIVPATPVSNEDASPTVGKVVPIRPTRRRSTLWGAALVAASLAVGLLVGRVVWRPDTASDQVAQTTLKTLDTKQAEGEATVVRAGGGLDLTVATARPLDAGSGYLEVWLINADGKRMVSVGVLGPGERATFPISQALIDQGYVVVDISKEQFDDKPAHSGDSLLRGRLPA